MRLKGNSIYVLASFATAFAIGYALQIGEADRAIFASSNNLNVALTNAPLVDPNSVQHTSAQAPTDQGLPYAPQAALESARLKNYPVNISDRMQESLAPSPEKKAPILNAYGVPCSTTLEAIATQAAMITVKLSASCALNKTFTLRQGELVVTGKTSSVGFAELSVPAMSVDPTLTVSFEDNSSVTTKLHVRDFDDFDRVALLWKGRTGLEIHALEFGADYGQAGHVWKNTPKSVAHATGSLGGFIMRVGNVQGPDAMHAEIYSFPSGTLRRKGAVRLSVETEITPFNCGRDILAQTLHPMSQTGMEVVDLVLAMPECDAIGDFLVLNNLFRDLKIASN